MTSARDEALARRLVANVDRRVALGTATGVLCAWMSCGPTRARAGLDDGQDGPLAEADRISAVVDAQAWLGSDPELL